MYRLGLWQRHLDEPANQFTRLVICQRPIISVSVTFFLHLTTIPFLNFLSLLPLCKDSDSAEKLYHPLPKERWIFGVLIKINIEARCKKTFTDINIFYLCR
jgi:hypothetical protein